MPGIATQSPLLLLFGNRRKTSYLFECYKFKVAEHLVDNCVATPFVWHEICTPPNFNTLATPLFLTKRVCTSPGWPDFLNNLAKPELVLPKNKLYKEKQIALIKVWLNYSCNLVTLYMYLSPKTPCMI